LSEDGPKNHVAVSQGDHSPDNVKFPDNSITVRDVPPRHLGC